MKFYSIPSTLALLAVVIGPVVAQTSAKDIILDIMPSSSSCDGDTLGECVTAEEAAPYLIEAMQTYGVYNVAQMAAILTTVAKESGEMKYKINHYPGRAGQGSSNMQMYKFNYEFATSIPELADKLNAISGDKTPDSASNETMNAVRALVIDNQYNFQTGPWYFNKYCTDAQKEAFSGSDLDAAFQDYSLNCIGVGAIEADRAEYWTKAKAAFGLS